MQKHNTTQKIFEYVMDVRQILRKCFILKFHPIYDRILQIWRTSFKYQQCVLVKSRIQESVPNPISFSKIEGPGYGTVLMHFSRCFHWNIGHLVVYLSFSLFYGNGMRRGGGFKTRSKYCFYLRTPALAFYLWCHRAALNMISQGAQKNFTSIKILSSSEFFPGLFHMPSLCRKSGKSVTNDLICVM